MSKNLNKTIEPQTDLNDNWSELMNSEYYSNYKSVIKSQIVDNLNINRIDVSHELNAKLNPKPKNNISQYSFIKESRLLREKEKKERMSQQNNYHCQEIVKDINILLDRLDHFPLKKITNSEFLNGNISSK